MNEQIQSFSFHPLINLVEEGKSLLAVTSVETTNSVFNISDENEGSQFLYQVIGTPNLLKKLLTN